MSDNSDRKNKKETQEPSLPEKCTHYGDYSIYSHGYDLRAKLLCSPEKHGEVLARIGLSLAQPSSNWIQQKRKNAEIFELSGGKPFGKDQGGQKPFKKSKKLSSSGKTSLTGRAPQNRRKSTKQFNSKWKTLFYRIGIELLGEEVFFDLKGTRIDDVKTFFESILKLTWQEYQVSYFRRLERYMVLNPRDALKLQQFLNEKGRQGRGPQSRKEFLFKDHELDLTIRQRKKAKCFLTSYRIVPGATYAYKVEVSLAGNRCSRGEFQAKDTVHLDEQLRRLVSNCALHPIRKPIRWEPKDPPPHKRYPLYLMTIGAYRGTLPRQEVQRWVSECHRGLQTAEARDPANCLLDSIPSFPSLIRDDLGSFECEATRLAQDGTPQGKSSNPQEVPDEVFKGWIDYDPRRIDPGYEKLAKEIQNNPPGLFEVIVDDQLDPGPIVEALCSLRELKSGITVFGGSQVWHSISQLVRKFPSSGDDQLQVIVFDISFSAPAYELVHHQTLTSLTDHPQGNVMEDPHYKVTKYIGVSLFSELNELRNFCEMEGQKVVLVTTDCRTNHAIDQEKKLVREYRNWKNSGDPNKKLRASKRTLPGGITFNDTFVRSSLGDAGRYNCHARYRVEIQESKLGIIVAVKDEVEGQTGRYVWRNH